MQEQACFHSVKPLVSELLAITSTLKHNQQVFYVQSIVPPPKFQPVRKCPSYKKISVSKTKSVAKIQKWMAGESWVKLSTNK